MRPDPKLHEVAAEEVVLAVAVAAGSVENAVVASKRTTQVLRISGGAILRVASPLFFCSHCTCQVAFLVRAINSGGKSFRGVRMIETKDRENQQ